MSWDQPQQQPDEPAGLVSVSPDWASGALSTGAVCDLALVSALPPPQHEPPFTWPWSLWGCAGFEISFMVILLIAVIASVQVCDRLACPHPKDARAVPILQFSLSPQRRLATILTFGPYRSHNP